jgi:hypothetical protein
MESYGSGKGSIQEAMRLGKAQDLYYYTSDNLKKESFCTIVDTRFYQALTTLGAGSSTFIISKDQGIGDVILAVELPEGTVGGAIDYTGLVLPRGWLYSSVNRTSVRYGSSSQYFWTGAQMLIENLREMPNPTTRDQLFQLGGALMTTVGDFAGDNLYAYAYINLPHNSPNGSMGKPLPYPSDLVGQPCVITVEFNPLPSIFSSLNGDLSAAPQAYASAYFQVRQTHARESSDLMSMGGRGSAYSFPLKAFYQNEVQIQVGSPSGVVATPTQHQILLTGFRNGEVRSIFFWITKNSDVNPANQTNGFVKNFTNYVLPKDIELLYNGTVFYRAFGPSAQMWSLITTETPPQLECTVLTLNGTAPTYTSITSASSLANWVEIPFSSVFEQLSGSHMYVCGKLIQNAVVNMSLTLPDSDAYTVHAVYSYNSALMISDGAAEYVF